MTDNIPKTETVSWQEISQRLWFRIISVLIIGMTLWSFWEQGIRQPVVDMNIDFSIYCFWSKHIQAGYPYLLNVDKWDYPSFYYPPFWGWVIAPFTWISYQTARLIWYGFNLIWIILFIGIVNNWMKKENYFNQSWYRYGFMIFILNFTPLFESIRHGQANIMILLLSAGVLWFYSKNKPVLAGICLGLATMIKILPLILIGYWFWKKQWRLVGTSLLTLLVLGSFSIGLSGFTAQWKFIRDNSIYTQYVKEHWLHQGNVSVYSLLRDSQTHGVLPAGISMYPVSFGIGVILFGYLLWRVPGKTESFHQTALEYSLILIFLFLSVPYSEHHQYLVLLIPFMIGWVYQEKIPNLSTRGFFLTAWILITMGFYLDDLSITLMNSYLSRYIHTFGVIATGIAILCWIGLKRENIISK